MKTTKKDYEYFQKRCLYWKERLGIQDWLLYFKHEKLNGTLAECFYNTRSRKATISLTISLTTSVNKINRGDWIEESAFHEMMHLLMADLTWMANMFDRNEVEEREHQIIHKLNNILLTSEKK